MKEPVKTDLEKDVLMPMTAEKRRSMPTVRRNSPGIGTVERLRKTEEDIESGFISARI